MKIQSSLIAPLDTQTYARVGRATARPAESSRAATLESSSFLSELQSAAAQSPWGEVRTDKVASARADLASGKLGSDADFAATVEALLREM